jgi:predicted alpha/beta hydrolase family esterase
MISPTVLLIPGYTNAGPEHWMTLWHATTPNYHRVQQLDWDNPYVDQWMNGLDQAIASAGADRSPIVLVAHSLGCLAVVHWALNTSDAGERVASALLVAPPDVEQPDTLDVLRRFAPIPQQKLPFPSIVVASTTDPYTHIDRARMLAKAWGARLVNVGDAGHINTSAGFGPWPQGEQLLATLLTPPRNQTEYLFSYGTLQQDNVQLATFGRLLDGSVDSLPGYMLSMLEITDPEVITTSGLRFHPVVTKSGDPGSKVPGMVFKITPDELLAADRYEVSDYERISVRLQSGIEAWVYVKATEETQFLP